jgi:NADH-quinone oxidoreductase B subunit
MSEHRDPVGDDPLRILGAPPPPPPRTSDLDTEVPEELRRSLFFARAESLIGWAVNQSRANSIWPLGSGLACCAIEMMCTLGPGFDISRLGAEVMRPSPRQSDLLIVAGRVSLRMAPVLRRLYDQMPDPKWAIAMGACASSGGIFNNYAILQGVDKVLPVDVYVPGCPPRPESLIYGVIKLQEKILASGVELGPLVRKRRPKEGS